MLSSPASPATVYLGLGSNLGDKQANIKQALLYITERVGAMLALSDYYETPSWGYHSQELYQNIVVAVATGLAPEELLAVTQDIERTSGRRHKTIGNEYHDRVIDIDILLYDDRIIDTPTLTIPHPLMHRRAFVMQPMKQIAPDIVHPVLHQTMEAIFSAGWGDTPSC